MNKTLLVSAFAALSMAACAQFTSVTNRGDLGANDYIDWTQFGANGVDVASGAHGFTHNGIGFVVSSDDDYGTDDGGALARRTEGVDWNGEFQPGDELLWHLNSYIPDGGDLHSVILIQFDVPVMGVGLQAQTNHQGDFDVSTGFWNPYPTTPIGVAFNSGTNNVGTHNGSAYVGGYDTTADITQMFVVAYMHDGLTDNWGFAVGQVDVVDPVPEPATLAVIGVGVAGLLARKRKA